MEQDTKSSVSLLPGLLKKYNSDSYQREWDTTFTTLLTSMMKLFQLRALTCSMDSKAAVHITVPVSMYRRLVLEIRKVNKDLEERDGHFILFSNLGDKIHVYSTDRANEEIIFKLQ